MSLLRVRDLKVNYGGIEALKGISFDVEKGQIVTLIGANGAGKSTTLRAISGLVPVKSGTITYDGNVIAGQQPQQIVAEGIDVAALPELQLQALLHRARADAGRLKRLHGLQRLPRGFGGYPGLGGEFIQLLRKVAAGR